MMAGIVFGVTLLFQSGKVAAAEAGKQEPGYYTFDVGSGEYGFKIE